MAASLADAGYVLYTMYGGKLTRKEWDARNALLEQARQRQKAIARAWPKALGYEDEVR